MPQKTTIHNVNGVPEVYFSATARTGNVFRDAQAGIVQGQTYVELVGENPSILTAGVPEDIWSGGGIYPGFTATGAETLDIVSTSADDTVTSGLGAWSILIEGLDATYEPITELVALNGLTPVTSVNSYLRINRTIAVQGGATASLTGNVGTLTLTQTTSTILMGQISAGDSTWLSAVFTVPNNKILRVQQVLLSLNDTNNAILGKLIVWFRPPGSLAYRTISIDSGNVGARNINVEWLTFPPKTDIAVRCIEVESNNVDISVSAACLLEDALA